MGVSRKSVYRFRGFSQWVVALLFMLYLPEFVAGQELVTENPNKVKAAFLRNFTHYVTWPANVFADDRSPWRICILGNDPFGDILDNTLMKRAEQGRPFEIHRAEILNALPRCQIIYIAYQDATKRRAALAELKKSPILTVGDASDFLQEGGIIQFQVGDRVEMRINLDQARSASLTIQTKMLEVSREIVENGAVKKWR
ncbi:MAG TPA: YfiR family protein [Burkholderiaceae bacterium]|nr:YfiR family protein [Burkholderiaceae bacterium]